MVFAFYSLRVTKFTIISFLGRFLYLLRSKDILNLLRAILNLLSTVKSKYFFKTTFMVETSIHKKSVRVINT